MQFIGYKDDTLLGKQVRVQLWIKFLEVCHKKRTVNGNSFGIGVYGNFYLAMDDCRPDEWMHVVVERVPNRLWDCKQVILLLDDVEEKGRIIQIAQMTVEVEGQGEFKETRRDVFVCMHVSVWMCVGRVGPTLWGCMFFCVKKCISETIE